MERRGTKNVIKKVQKKDLAHVMSCRKNLLRYNNKKDLETKNGYAIYKWCRNYLETDDFSVHKFWVVKHDKGKYKRGQKIMNKAEQQKFIKSGGETREIKCHGELTRLHMRELIEPLDLTMPNRHGFKRNRDIFTLMEKASQRAELGNRFKGTVVSLDMKDAFEQVTKDQVYLIFKKIFDLNHKDSQKLSEICTVNGHLFQGCTISPLIFNIWFSRVFERIETMRNDNFELYTYADDITIIIDYSSLSWKFLKFLVKVIEQCGFKINKRKTKVRNAQHMEVCGLQWKTNPLGEWKIYPRGTKKLKSKIRMWRYLIQKGITTSKRLNKNSEAIMTAEILKGLENWYSRSTSFQPL